MKKMENATRENPVYIYRVHAPPRIHRDKSKSVTVHILQATQKQTPEPYLFDTHHTPIMDCERVEIPSGGCLFIRSANE